MESGKKLCIVGGAPLRGTVTMSGAKNSAVALIPAALLASSPVVLDNLPSISDVHVYVHLLETLGAKIAFEDGTMTIDAREVVPRPLADGKASQLRASYYLLGALLGRCGEAIIGLPGGCNFEPRPIDQHIKGFEALGAKVTNEHGAIRVVAKRLRGARIYLDVASVGATINIMLAATRAEGTTIIENVAKEPEIVDVATLLTSMGARIKGAGTETIRIEGVQHIHGCRHMIIPDRIQAGTYLIAAAATGGDVTVDNVIPKHMEALCAKLIEMGAVVQEMDEAIRVVGANSYSSIDVKAFVYPGFATDLQAQMTALLTRAHGVSVVTDYVYSNRFKHVAELQRMGAKVRVEGRSAIVMHSALHGAAVQATDLRAGAALCIAGLMAANGEQTDIYGYEYIQRGYEGLVDQLRSLGADVWEQ
ncbi:MAG: UDP-N-acetylglucosamine 1-carboxyvinyltransferase [Paenibacillaceae bacterium]|nr:UDP-N-acetylglucosamine 1-carboxyvinyltransferase [Paenibacillaceae bacterium]